MTAELTLGAALRDATSIHDNARNMAIRNLAPALLEELGRASPAWCAHKDHSRGPEVRDALRHATIHDPVPVIRGLGSIGLGQLGDGWVVGTVGPWLAAAGDTNDDFFLRECAVIALSFIGAAAPAEDPNRERVLGELREAMQSGHDDVRFQACVALAEVAGREAEPELVAALEREVHPEVRESLVSALSVLDPLGPEACDALEHILAAPNAGEPIGFLAAMALAAARRPSAAARLVTALDYRETRDDALEALAVLAPNVPDGVVDRLRHMAGSIWTPAITRVRAAYVLARTNPKDGLARLAKMSWHPRRAVREAVADARAAIARLDAEA